MHTLEIDHMSSKLVSLSSIRYTSSTNDIRKEANVSGMIDRIYRKMLFLVHVQSVCLEHIKNHGILSIGGLVNDIKLYKLFEIIILIQKRNTIGLVLTRIAMLRK